MKEILCESENQDRGCRLPAVNKISEAPRPYVVKSQGTSFRRNRRDLIKMANPVSEQLKDSEVICSSQVHNSVVPKKVSSKGQTIQPPVWVKDYVTVYLRLVC